MTQLLHGTFGPQTVIGQEFVLAGADRVLIYGSWAARNHGTPGAPPNDVDVLVVGDVDRADVYDAADRAQVRLGMQVSPVIRTPEQWAEDSDSLVLQIKASPSLDVTPTRIGARLSHWPRGEAEIEHLIASKQLQRVAGGQANGEHLLERAVRTVATASAIAQDNTDSA